MTLRRIKHTLAFDERLALESLGLKHQAKAMPHGNERNSILRRAKKVEIAMYISESLRSPSMFTQVRK
jgi:hypothetical protein